MPCWMIGLYSLFMCCPLPRNSYSLHIHLFMSAHRLVVILFSKWTCACYSLIIWLFNCWFNFLVSFFFFKLLISSVLISCCWVHLQSIYKSYCWFWALQHCYVWRTFLSALWSCIQISLNFDIFKLIWGTKLIQSQKFTP